MSEPRQKLADRIQWTGENIATVSWFLKSDVFRLKSDGLKVVLGDGSTLYAARGDWLVRQWDGSYAVEASWL